MRLDLNLATHPYEDARDFYLKWGTAVVVLLAITVALVTMAVSGVRQSREVTREVRARQDEIAKMKGDEQKAQAYLNLPQNQSMRAQSALLNELIARKAFSWTQVFSDLEKLMPTRVRVNSIRPQLDSDNQLMVVMSVSSDSRDKAIELLKNLEDSKHFRLAELTSEANEVQGANGSSFQISAIYVPANLPAETAQPTPAGGAK